MQYKTLALQLIRQYPLVHYPLKEKRMLLETVEREAKELATRHQELKEQLFQNQPDSDPASTESASLELALKELENRLSAERLQGNPEISLDGAMAFLRKATPPA
jgi:hypothetical protein